VLGGVVGSAAILAGTQAGIGAVPIYDSQGGNLGDFQVAKGPFDGATGSLRIMQTSERGTNFKLRVEGIDPAVAGIEYGAHLHIGPCVDGDIGGALAGLHYNHQMFPAGSLTNYAAAEKNPSTEVWLNFVPDDNGIAADSTLVPFEPVDLDGVMSIVIHAEQTNPDTGGAGARQACFPVKAPTDWIYQPVATG